MSWWGWLEVKYFFVGCHNQSRYSFAPTPIGKCAFEAPKGTCEVFGWRLVWLRHWNIGTYQDLHDVAKAPPSRRLSVGPVGNSVSMPVGNIWEVLDHAQTSGKSARQAIEFCQTRLSNAGGCSANSADSWVRRRQIIYDIRVVASMVGACHFNLVSDCSKHSGKDRRGPQSLDLGR